MTEDEMEMQPTTLPDSIEPFARGVAELARAAGLTSVDVEIQLDWRADFRGKIKVEWWATDGRGRPSENLVVSAETTLRKPLIHAPSSHD